MDLRDFVPEPDLANARTLPSRWYLDPEIFEAERERIFSRTWQPLARAEDLARPGDFVAAEIAGEPLVFVRDGEGVLRALANVCRHRASVIASGKGNRRSLQCPYHGWTYALDGRLLAAPEFEGVRDWDRSKVCLPAARAETWRPFAFANLAPDGPPLSEILATIPSEVDRFGISLDALRFRARREWRVRCNWKVYVDNFLEGYHLPTAHPSLHRELDYSRYRVDTFRYHSSQFAPIRPARSGEGERRYAAAGDETGALYYWVFPNTMLNVYPDNLSLNLIVPLSLDETLVVFEWYFPAGDSAAIEESARRTIAFSDEIQAEDVAICESVQRGLRSRTYAQGRFSAKRESGVHHFHGLVHEFLTASPTA